MKKNITIILALAFMAVLFPSCKNLVPYTDALQKERKWSNEQLTNAQFYLSEDIVLERTLAKEFPDQIVGKIIMKDGVKKEVVLLPRKLPMVFTGTTSTGAYSIQCDQGDCKLTFGVNPDKAGQYVLLATEWKNGFGKVHYNNTEYFVSTEQSSAHLLIDLRKKTDQNNNFHVAKGVKVKPQKS